MVKICELVLVDLLMLRAFVFKAVDRWLNQKLGTRIAAIK